MVSRNRDGVTNRYLRHITRELKSPGCTKYHRLFLFEPQQERKRTLSEQQYNQPFIPPPPPSVGNSMFPQHVLDAKAKQIADDAKQALIMGIVGVFCFGFILGIMAVRKANSAHEASMSMKSAWTIVVLQLAQKCLASSISWLGFSC